MRSLLSRLTVAVAMLAHVPGCSLLPWDGAPVMVEDVLPSMRAQGIALDESQIPSYAAVRETVAPLLSDVQQPLTAAECACRAAAASQVAAVLQQEAAYLCSQTTAHHRRGVSQLLPDILADQARRERNNAAEQRTGGLLSIGRS